MKRLSQCIILSKSKAVVFPSEASCYFYSARDYYSQDYCLVKGELEVSRVVVLHRAAVSWDSHKKPVSFYHRARHLITIDWSYNFVFFFTSITEFVKVFFNLFLQEMCILLTYTVAFLVDKTKHLLLVEKKMKIVPS